MVKQAIVIASDAPDVAFKPHETRVAGLTLLKRTLAMLQWAGIQETFVVTGPWETDAARATLAGDKDLDSGKMRVRWATDDGALERGGLSVGSVARHIRGQAVLVRSDRAYDRDIIRNLMNETVEPGHVVTASDRGACVGMLVADRAAFTAFNGHRVEKALAAFRVQGRVRRMDVAGRFWVRVRNEKSVREAEDLLWDSCRKPHDGIVAKTLNRNISIAISRRIAHLPVHPNHVSMVTFALGIATAFCVAQGGYGWFVLGALLFKINSILDGVDGELSRVRYQMSVLGEWLDTLSDDISNMLFFVALAIGAHRMTGDPMWLTLGWLTAIPSLLSTAYQYTILIRGGRGDLLAINWLFERGHGKGDDEQGFLGRLLNEKLKYVVKKDFFVFLVLLVAIAGLLPWMLFLTTLVNLILLTTIVIQAVMVRRARRAGEDVELVLTNPTPTEPVAEPTAKAPAPQTRRPAPARR